MPCCAFAAFLASQVLLALSTIKRLLLLRSPETLAIGRDNPATEWRLGVSSPAPAPPWICRFGLRPLAIAASIEIVLVIGTAAVVYHRHTQGHSHFEFAGLASAPVCGGGLR